MRDESCEKKLLCARKNYYVLEKIIFRIKREWINRVILSTKFHVKRNNNVTFIMKFYF